MIHILICDDDLSFINKTENCLYSYLMTSAYSDLEYDIKITTISRSLKKIAKECPPDILILDIHMPEVDGLEIAEEFYNCSAKTRIIFLTSYEELVFYSLRFSPFRFVRKNHMTKELPEAIDSAIRLLVNESTCLTVKKYNDTQYVPINQIKYIEKIKNRNSVNLYCTNEIIQHRETIQTLEQSLKDFGIIKINSGTLVNLKYIKRLNGTDIYIGDEILKVSAAHLDSVKHSISKSMRLFG